MTCHPSTSGKNLQSDFLNVRSKRTRTGIYVVCVFGCLNACMCMRVHVYMCVHLLSPNNHNDLSAFLYKRGLHNF